MHASADAWLRDARACLPAQTLGLECRVVQHSTPDGCAAQSVALSPELLLSGWADGHIRCHARSGPKPGAAMWSIPNAHASAHAIGVPALQLSNKWVCTACEAWTSIGAPCAFMPLTVLTLTRLLLHCCHSAAAHSSRLEGLAASCACGTCAAKASWSRT